MNAFFRKVLSGPLAVLGIALLLLGSGCGTVPSYRGKQFKRLSTRQVDQLELTAQGARAQFHQGQYDQAVAAYDGLLADFTVSYPLYSCEKAMSSWAKGDKAAAKAALRDAETLLEGFIDVKGEKKAASLWGNENEKVFKGDPYEQSTLYLLLGLLFLDEGDADNALACFKSGALADGDVKEDRYKADYGLLQALQAKCHALRGEQDAWRQCHDLALTSFRETHPAVIWRTQAYEALTKLDAAPKATMMAAAKAAPSDEAIAKLKKAIDEARAAVDLKYCDPLFGDYNTLLLVWHGKAPFMQRYGQYGEHRAIVMQPTVGENRYEICIDGKAWADGRRGFANIGFQATTRGGRLMDDVLANQAAFKTFAYNMGDSLIRNANTGNPYADLTILTVGAVMWGVSAATKVEADVRCWQTLPEEFHVAPLKLAPGRHEFLVEHYNMLLKTGEHHVSAEIKDGNLVNVVLIMPPAPEAPKEGATLAKN